jgi:hypothetical protein
MRVSAQAILIYEFYVGALLFNSLNRILRTMLAVALALGCLELSKLMGNYFSRSGFLGQFWPW